LLRMSLICRTMGEDPYSFTGHGAEPHTSIGWAGGGKSLCGEQQGRSFDSLHSLRMTLFGMLCDAEQERALREAPLKNARNKYFVRLGCGKGAFETLYEGTIRRTESPSQPTADSPQRLLLAEKSWLRRGDAPSRPLRRVIPL